MLNHLERVNPEYKITEIGEIPVEWKIVDFFEHIESVLDFRGRTPKKLDMDWGGGSIAALSANNVKMGYIDFSAECYLGSEELYQKWMTKGDVSQGDVLMTMEAPLGNVAQVPDNKKYILSQRVVAFKTDEYLSNEYLKYFLMSPQFQKSLERNSTGTTAKGISQKNLSNLKISIPPIKEQRKIADILTTVDEQIENIDQLMAKTKKLKKGLIQKLFTMGINHIVFNDTEIGTIPAKWEVSELNDIVVKIVGGGTPARENFSYYNGEIPWITVKDMDGSFYKSKSQEYITEIAINESSANLIDKYQVIIATRIALGRGFINTEPIAINQDLKALYLNKKVIIPEYFLYWYLGQKDKIERMGSGSTVKGIRLEQLRKIKVPLPRLEEQQQIADILATVDEQIESYEQEREKYIEFKKGLMQQLLTGKIRVTV
ncbi:hypothetical protein COK90_08845 [Priestia megaterium]|uniref:restriction endonuclease subunit S n=1 Tax=Priestia megaterium TaxID=1404 RepID=UPI000BF8B2FA|nr:restriction endonuclease subunit S [Priestia megaterium]PFU64052.1 hypothetical protein COK90_08845 [Priestia megaterium]